MTSIARTEIHNPLAHFAEALASFRAHPTPEKFRAIQIAGRMLDDVRQTGAANDQEPFGRRPPVPSTEGSVG
jgi:hypothetical protein